MARFFDDPLLHGTKGLLRVAYMLCFGVAAFLVVAATVSYLVADSTSSVLTPAQLRNGTIQMVSVAPFLAIVGWFVRILWQIVSSVTTGSPFASVNADRLTRMGWIALVLTGLSLVQTLTINASATLFDPSGSVLLALTLFILARVFRQGAAMREDLEGTV